MAFAYLPVLAEQRAPNAPRMLAPPSRAAQLLETPPLALTRIALLTSAALRLPAQPGFTPPADTSYRIIPHDAPASALVTDHRSPVGTDARRDWEIVFPRAALAALAAQGIVGSGAPGHFSFVGATERHRQVEEELAPALMAELRQANAGLAVLVPY